jgi:succinate-acetate transporter protein
MLAAVLEFMAAAGTTAAPQDYHKPPVTPSADWANPAVLGLMAFGLTTMLAGIANTSSGWGGGLWNDPGGAGSNLLAMALAFGGALQVIAGVIALRKGEIFAGTAFVGYGGFWLAYFWIVNNIALIPAAGVAADLMWFSIVWGLFTVAFVINAPKHGPGITAIFAFLTVAFILLTVNFGMQVPGQAWASGAPAGWSNFMGLEIFATGLIAWFVALGILTNANYGRRLIPI